MFIKSISLAMIALLVFPCALWAHIVRVKVFERDTPKRSGFACEVFKKGSKSMRGCIFEAGKDIAVGYIDAEGEAEIDINCKAGERILLLPKYMNLEPMCMRCPVKAEEQVGFTRTAIVKNLLLSVERSLRMGRYAAAAQAYSEIASRFTMYHDKSRAQFELEAYRNMARFFNLPNGVGFSYDAARDKASMSVPLKEKIAEFQLQNDISVKVPGQLDTATYRAASKLKPYQLLYSVDKIKRLEQFTYSPGDFDYNELLKWVLPEKKRQIQPLVVQLQSTDSKNTAAKSLLFNKMIGEIYLWESRDPGAVIWAKKAETEVYSNFGQFLKVKRPFVYDPLQGRNTITYDMKAAVEAFQKQSNISQTGMIDTKTLLKAIDVSKGGFQ
jgi:hypothetical protein